VFISSATTMILAKPLHRSYLAASANYIFRSHELGGRRGGEESKNYCVRAAKPSDQKKPVVCSVATYLY